MSLHLHRLPFKNTLENTLEEIVYLDLLITFAGVGYHQVSQVSGGVGLGITLLVMNIATITILLLALFSRKVCIYFWS